MKLQLDNQHLRVRVDEAEFARLLSGQTLDSTTTLPGMQLMLVLAPVSDGPATVTAGTHHITLHLPVPDLFAYQQRLPCRDGLAFSQPLDARLQLHVAFEVDIRDSVRQRGPRRRDAST